MFRLLDLPTDTLAQIVSYDPQPWSFCSHGFRELAIPSLYRTLAVTSLSMPLITRYMSLLADLKSNTAPPFLVQYVRRLHIIGHDTFEHPINQETSAGYISDFKSHLEIATFILSESWHPLKAKTPITEHVISNIRPYPEYFLPDNVNFQIFELDLILKVIHMWFHDLLAEIIPFFPNISSLTIHDSARVDILLRSLFETCTLETLNITRCNIDFPLHLGASLLHHFASIKNLKFNVDTIHTDEPGPHDISSLLAVSQPQKLDISFRVYVNDMVTAFPDVYNLPLTRWLIIKSFLRTNIALKTVCAPSLQYFEGPTDFFLSIKSEHASQLKTLVINAHMSLVEYYEVVERSNQVVDLSVTISNLEENNLAALFSALPPSVVKFRCLTSNILSLELGCQHVWTQGITQPCPNLRQLQLYWFHGAERIDKPDAVAEPLLHEELVTLRNTFRELQRYEVRFGDNSKLVAWWDDL